MIQITPHGYYHWDYTEKLWSHLKKRMPENFVGLSEYTGSQMDKAAIDTTMERILNYPDNPFFDWKTAKETGGYAFSMNRYLERYRTLADDGTTRLIVGETAGNRISANTINNIDVCLPTHVTIELGENDRWWFPNNPEQTVRDVKQMMDAIHREYPDIEVAFLTTRMMGVFYPDLWNDVAVLPAMSVTSNTFKYNVTEQIQNLLGTLEQQRQKKCYTLPTYHVHSALSFSKSRRDISLATGHEITVGISGDINHPGPEANATMGYQILSWIYYTLAQ